MKASFFVEEDEGIEDDGGMLDVRGGDIFGRWGNEVYCRRLCVDAEAADYILFLKGLDLVMVGKLTRGV